jgi:putative ABC transport system permease protein
MTPTLPSIKTITTITAQRPRPVFGDMMSFAYDTFCSNKVRFALTSLGMVIGTASLILVATISLTGKQYLLNQIQSIGSNWIYAEYQSGSQRINNAASDPLTLDDLTAVRTAVSGIIAASPAIDLSDRIPVGGGKERDIHILGVSPEYRIVRNLVIVSGTFFDIQDQQGHNKVAVIVDKLAQALYGSPEDAIGKVLKVSGLPFTIVGTFRERVDTFGQSEVTDNTLLMPYTVARYFTDVPTVKQLHFSVADSSMVVPVTEQIKRVIQSRHRAESVYSVDNLTQLVSLADKTANMLTLTLALISLVVLLVSGIGIMNIMLATVSARIREIGIRKAIGATNREIRLQFLSEAILISLVGGLIGVIIGLAIPYSVRFLTEYRIPISGLSAIVAIAVSSLVGIIFGTVPATRAAKLDPVESLRYE